MDWLDLRAGCNGGGRAFFPEGFSTLNTKPYNLNPDP